MWGEDGGRAKGFTLTELLVGLALLGGAGVLGLAAWQTHAGAGALRGATRVVRGALDAGRLTAVSRRGVVRLRLEDGGRLVLYDAGDRELRGWAVGRDGPFRTDSVRLRPRTLRFNSRGQAAPGSIYLYRGRAGVRLVINFLGRVREERFTLR